MLIPHCWFDFNDALVLSQVHAVLPRLLFHVNDEALAVRDACKVCQALVPRSTQFSSELLTTRVTKYLSAEHFEKDIAAAAHGGSEIVDKRPIL